MNAARLRWEDIKLNDVFTFSRQITGADAQAFAQLSGDFNPLHVDASFGVQSKFGRNVVHGMMVSSLFSQLVGMHCPGENSLYVSQTLNFRKPTFYDDTLTVKGTVIDKRDSLRLVTLKTEIVRGDEVLIFGEAKVMVLEGSV